MRSLLLMATLVACLFGMVPLGSAAACQELDAELEAMLEEERGEAELLRRAGQFRDAKRLVNEHLDEEPDDWRSLAIRGRVYADQAEWVRAEKDLARSFDLARGGAADEALLIGLDWANLELELGRASGALARLEALVGSSSRRDWLTGRAYLEMGQREAALERFAAPSERSAEGEDWVEFLYRARCERELGQLEAASYSLVAADKLAGGRSAEVLVELASVYLESDGEVAQAGSSDRRPGELFREALELCPEHPGALLGLFRLHDLNWRRSSRSARSFLRELLDGKPDSVAGQLALLGDHIGNGEFRAARDVAGALGKLAPDLRRVRSAVARLERIGGDAGKGDAMLAALESEVEWDSEPARACGEGLIDLYRFAEALPFLQNATERNPRDWQAWALLGEALSNTGDEVGGLSALKRAKDASEGRQDAWRNNLTMVLSKMAERWEVVSGEGRLTYAFPPLGHEVLERVLIPFYAQTREELAARYGCTPGPTRIESFDRHGDFSVRSTGFEGFPALGVCFGPVVTALSPLCEMRGTFSWAETSFHEFSHVIHLELSHNRCPRWITEGLATWEEEQRNPAWTRNLRRELVDSYHGGGIIGVRDLNRAFRGPRIIWAYYQGKLMCDLLIDAYGFPAMVDFLLAFDRGLDLDDALEAAFGLTPEQLDHDFMQHLEGVVSQLKVEPRRDPAAARVMAFSLGRKAPDDGRGQWAEGWCDVAWTAWQGGRRIDAEEALRHLRKADLAPWRAQFLRGEMALEAADVEAAAAHFDLGFAAGGEDYRARMARASIAGAAGEHELLLEHLLAAEQAFPGWDEAALSAELALVRHFESQDDEAAAMGARERWLLWNSGDVQMRLQVANFRMQRGSPGDFEAALKLYQGAMEVDPFRAGAHVGMGQALVELGRMDQAIWALETALLVPANLDAEFGAGPIVAGPLDAEALAPYQATIEARQKLIEELLKRARG